MADTLPPEILKKIKSVTNKRARRVLDRIAQDGSINTEQIKSLGYDDPRRARQDAKDLGFPIIGTRVKSSTGKSIAAYSFDLTGALCETRSGRNVIPKKRRAALIAACGSKCRICGATHNLQVDHRVPFQVAGESLQDSDDPYMVLDGSCNRSKSWACEHCENFLTLRQIEICQNCYWANPDEHTHVAMEQTRRLDVAWQRDETAEFDAFREQCEREGRSLGAAVKSILKSGK